MKERKPYEFIASLNLHRFDFNKTWKQDNRQNEKVVKRYFVPHLQDHLKTSLASAARKGSELDEEGEKEAQVAAEEYLLKWQENKFNTLRTKFVASKDENRFV